MDPTAEPASCSPDPNKWLNFKHQTLLSSFSRVVNTTINDFYTSYYLIIWIWFYTVFFGLRLVCLFPLHGSLIPFVPCVLSLQLKVVPNDLDMGPWLLFIFSRVMSEKKQDWEKSGGSESWGKIESLISDDKLSKYSTLKKIHSFLGILKLLIFS